VILGGFVGLLALEVALQLRLAVVYRWQPSVRGTLYVSDPRLGHRLNPAYPAGHGIGGWRNISTPDDAYAVVFGDSQTYGVGLPVEESWPHALGQLLGRHTMQMAAPGYGPGHYLALYDEARAYTPDVIIAAYYLGNDLFGAYSMAYQLEDQSRSISEPDLDALKTTDPPAVAAVAKAEATDPGFLRALYLDCQLPRSVPDLRLQAVRGVMELPELKPLAAVPAEGLATTLVKQSAVIAGMRRGLAWLAPRLGYVNTMADYGSPVCVNYHDNDLTTVFSPGYRLIALDDSDPRIAEGERIGLAVLQQLHDRSRREGRRLFVVIIPTKETAFRSRVDKALAGEPYLAELWRREARARMSAVQFFEQSGIDVIDTLPALEALIASGINPYWDNADGHPREAGHKAIAAAVARRLEADARQE
jgi:hypothetical protein